MTSSFKHAFSFLQKLERLKFPFWIAVMFICAIAAGSDYQISLSPSQGFHFAPAVSDVADQQRQ